MARFGTTPPTDALPRAQMDPPPQAVRPDDFALPDVPAEHPTPDLGGEDAPHGLPMIPVERFAQGLGGELPEEVELPDIFVL